MVSEPRAVADPMAGFVKIPRAPHESARSWSYRVLLHNIAHLYLTPGSCLVETEVRQRLGVSRTPIREAFMQLAQEKFIQIVPQKGTYVTRIDMSQVLELRYIRRCVEAETTREAARRGMTPETAAALDGALADQLRTAERQDFEGFIAADDEMHRLLYAVAGREGSWNFFNKNNLHHYRSRILGLRAHGTFPRLLGEHREIIDAVRAGDPDRAEAGARQHLSDRDWNANSVQEKFPEYIMPPH